MKFNRLIYLYLATAFTLSGVDALCADTGEGKIDRKAVVSRHDIYLEASLPHSPAQVGNGRFAFGMDISGLQSFIPFSTLSDWGWHSFPLPEGLKVEDYKPVYIESYGQRIPYLDHNPETEEASQYLKANPHRVNLGRIGFILLREDGSPACESDLKETQQYTELWSGEVRSRFNLEGRPVQVTTVCHPDKDQISVRVESELCQEGRLKVFISFPYADNKSFNKFPGDYNCNDRHRSGIVACSGNGAVLEHEMDNLKYWLSISWSGKTYLESKGEHCYELQPHSKIWECSFLFSKDRDERTEEFAGTAEKSRQEWDRFWMSGAAVDLSGSTDPRWKELERRIVLSQYLMRINESGLLPPQESGLVNNGWYGRFHFEMIWWHAAHYFLWNRGECCSQMLRVYENFLPGARERAAMEGRSGARWPKCTADFNREWPCSAHAYLIWQEPHPIYFAELEYRNSPAPEKTLEKWGQIVLETADYMADYVFWDGKRYVIGPPVTPVSENTDPLQTLNPAFELCYFRYGLNTALQWAKRMGLPAKRCEKWKKVLKHLASPPVENGYYITEENMKDMWDSHNYEHPAITGMYGWLPGDGVDKRTFRRTFYKVLDEWKMDKIWGWDFPMLAMAAARIGDPAKAIDLLTTTEHKFGFDAHGFADTWPFPYFPANGGLLAAVAMMCEGWDGAGGDAPGFPKDGSWSVKYEGFKRMP